MWFLYDFQQEIEELYELVCREHEEAKIEFVAPEFTLDSITDIPLCVYFQSRDRWF